MSKMLSKSTVDILTESAKIENFSLIRENVAKSKKEIYDLLLNLEEVDEEALQCGVDEAAEEVGVYPYSRGRYLIEYSDLSRFMQRTKVASAKIAIDKICEHYNSQDPNFISANVHVMIESVENIMNDIQESIVCYESSNVIYKNYGKEKLESVYEALQELIQSGIKVMTKPSNTNKRIY